MLWEKAFKSQSQLPSALLQGRGGEIHFVKYVTSTRVLPQNCHILGFCPALISEWREARRRRLTKLNIQAVAEVPLYSRTFSLVMMHALFELRTSTPPQHLTSFSVSKNYPYRVWAARELNLSFIALGTTSLNGHSEKGLCVHLRVM